MYVYNVMNFMHMYRQFTQYSFGTIVFNSFLHFSQSFEAALELITLFVL